MTERTIPAVSIANSEIQLNNIGEALRAARRLKNSFTANTKNSAAIYTRFSAIVPKRRYPARLPKAEATAYVGESAAANETPKPEILFKIRAFDSRTEARKTMAHRTATAKWSDLTGSADDLISILDFTEDTPMLYFRFL